MESIKMLSFIAAAIAATGASACSRQSTSSPNFESQVGRDTAEDLATPDAEPFSIESPAFTNGAHLDREYTHDGGNHAPALSWKGAPPGTKSFALEVLDPDAPTGTFAHWLVWDIPANAKSLDDAPGIQGKNDAGRLGWTGPEPPPGSGDHHYVFRLYALDVPTVGLREQATRADLDAAMRAHVLGTTQTTGLYGR